ncbi:MAG: ABC transporter ATP-binding protein/permease, partial [Chloroflexota bacterium]|nr:ABC transporter ATP-binding protein/permease [Chloroflexota bacterium]
MFTEAWTTRAAGPLTFHYHEGSFAHENIEAIVERYEKALADVRGALDVGALPGGSITVYLCEVLDDEPGEPPGSTNTRLDLDGATLWTVVTSLSAGAYPEFELTRIVLHLTYGPIAPAARFWEDGLAGYLAGLGGATYYAEAPARARKMREEGQLRPLVAVVRQYHEHRSPAATTVATAFATHLIQWRGLERYRRFLLAGGSLDALRKEYGRPLAALDQLWNRKMELSARASGGKTLAAIKGAAPYFRPYRWRLVGIFVTVLLGLSFDLFMPQAIRFLIDSVLGHRPFAFPIPFIAPSGYRIQPGEETRWLLGLLAVMVCMFLLNAFARLRQAAMTAEVSQSVVFDLRMRFLDHLQLLPLSFHSRTPASEVVQRFQSDIAYVAAALSAGLAPMVSNGIAMLLFGAMLISLNPWLSIIAIAGLPIFAFSYRAGRATMRQNQRETVRRNQEIQQAVIENMNAQPLLKSWGQRAAQMERFREKLELNREINIRNAMVTQAFSRASVLITNGAQVAVLVAGGLIVIWSNGQDLSAGGLTAFYILLLRLYGPAGLFAGAFQTLSLSADGLERVTKILEREPEVDRPDARQAGPLTDAIRAEGATYAPTKGKYLLKDVTLEIEAGSKVAFVGPTGAGKATLMQLLPGLVELTEGR